MLVDGDVLGIVAHVGDIRELMGTRHAADNSHARLDGERGRGVVLLGPELKSLAIPEVDGPVSISKSLGEHDQRPSKDLIGLSTNDQGAADRFHTRDLA